MTRSGHGGTMVARRAHVGGGKEENGKRRNRDLGGIEIGVKKRVMTVDELRRAVLDRIPKKKKVLKENFLKAFHNGKRISDAVFLYLPDPEVTLDKGWKDGVLYLRSLGKKRTL